MTNLIVISNESDLEREVLLVNELFEEGMELYHLRKPFWNIDFQKYFLSRIKPEFRNKISVHQHHETIDSFGLKYFHVKETNRTEFKKPNDLICSTSYHTLLDLERDAVNFDYCFLSPLFNSISKSEYNSKFETDFHLSPSTAKVFALGGINKNNIDKVFDKGFYGAAILGAIWKDPDNAVANFSKLKEACSKNVHMS